MSLSHPDLPLPRWLSASWVLLLLLVACSKQESPPNNNTVAAADPVGKRVEAIQREVTRIDALSEEPDTAERRRVTRELPHWQFFGMFDKSVPVFLNATFSEGNLVREEKYYLVAGELVFIKVEQWWDVEDEKAAPDPPTRQIFYIENGRKIRQVSEVDSSPPATRQNDTTESADALMQRSRTIAQIVSGGETQAAIPNSLAVFPYTVNAPPR